jgi:uncharacterized damage-inducible protein DinB
MITPHYVRALSAYNAEMNRQFYSAAALLSDDERKLDRGAFFGSIHGTFNHLLWADAAWMSRFAGWPMPGEKPERGNPIFGDFDEMHARRLKLDEDICSWAAGLTEDWLVGDLTWFSAMAGREMTARKTAILIHMFNHQTHHRGQAHAMLTAAGQDTGDTCIALILSPSTWA